MNLNVIRIHDLLKSQKQRLVLVESCTSGWIASQFGSIPGISEFFCGSLVVYRNASKHEWLGIHSEVLNSTEIGPVSEQVTRELAQSALVHTPEATIAAAITGHLGPGSPRDLDGIVFIAIANRADHTLTTHIALKSQSNSIRAKLRSAEPKTTLDYDSRAARQIEAGELLIHYLCDYLSSDA